MVNITPRESVFSCIFLLNTMDSAYPAPHLEKHHGLAVQDADVDALNDLCDSRGAQSLIDVARSTMTWPQTMVKVATETCDSLSWDDLGVNFEKF